MIKYDRRKFDIYKIPGVDEAEYNTEDLDIISVKSDGKDSNSMFKSCMLCGKKSINLIVCKYCKWSFCKNHIKPKHLDDPLNRSGGHPCTEYSRTHEYIKPIINKKKSIFRRNK